MLGRHTVARQALDHLSGTILEIPTSIMIYDDDGRFVDYLEKFNPA